MTVRTRFAPSPTGYLHIGGVRTALFNWLLARRHGGQFILRIDDTDAERNRPEALQPILDGFRWLGIDWDEGPEVGGPHGPYFQSQRHDRYLAAAMRLLETGHAYPDYQTKEQLDAQRQQAAVQALLAKKPDASEAELARERQEALEGKRAYYHRGPLRDADPADNLRAYRDRPAPLRLKVPTGRTIVLDDLIRGRVEVQTDLIGDPVILRAPDADGTARSLYNFATVVDDIDFQITHVIRAVEHLSNTPVQLLIYEALGASVPRFAHIPVVNAPKSKEKLSKRKMGQFMTPEVISKLRAVHAVPDGLTDEQIKKLEHLNPATVAYYQALGYLPAGLVNYLARLGWSLDDHSEMIPLEQLIANFSLERVTDAPASFDPDKLHWLAGEYMKRLPLPEKVAGCMPFLQRAGLADESQRPRVEALVEACGERLKLFSDILAYAAPFLRETVEYDGKAVEKRLKKPGAAELLRDFAQRLATVEPFDAPTLDRLLHDYCAERGLGAGELVHPLRVATTGSAVGIGLFEALAILGREVCLRRIEQALTL
jgi:glutamyl/glutaminyl-tRNA synthetase